MNIKEIPRIVFNNFFVIVITYALFEILNTTLRSINWVFVKVKSKI